jgi:hypothetical protein
VTVIDDLLHHHSDVISTGAARAASDALQSGETLCFSCAARIVQKRKVPIRLLRFGQSLRAGTRLRMNLAALESCFARDDRVGIGSWSCAALGSSCCLCKADCTTTTMSSRPEKRGACDALQSGETLWFSCAARIVQKRKLPRLRTSFRFAQIMLRSG